MRNKNHISVIIISIIAVCLLWFLVSINLLVETQFGNVGDRFQILNTLFAGLAFGVLIYTILLQQKELELQRTQLELNRKETERSANALEQQAQSLHYSKLVAFTSSLPYLLVGIAHKSLITSSDKFGDIRTISMPAIGAKYKEHKISNFFFHVLNASNSIASHITCILWDNNIKSFRISEPIEVIRPNEEIFLGILTHQFKLEDVKELVQKLYENRGDYIKEWLEAIKKFSEDNYMLVLFFDISGRLYLIPRLVYFEKLEDEAKISYGKSDLAQPNDMGFAPPFETTLEIISKLKALRLTTTNQKYYID